MKMLPQEVYIALPVNINEFYGFFHIKFGVWCNI
jgi:hypothetical protein